MAQRRVIETRTEDLQRQLRHDSVHKANVQSDGRVEYLRRVRRTEAEEAELAQMESLERVRWRRVSLVQSAPDGNRNASRRATGSGRGGWVTRRSHVPVFGGGVVRSSQPSRHSASARSRLRWRSRRRVWWPSSSAAKPSRFAKRN